MSVGWPTTDGLWLAEFDTNLYGIEEDDLLLADILRLRLARTMDERCAILRDHFNATFYEDIQDYNGYSFLNMWDETKTGEAGPL